MAFDLGLNFRSTLGYVTDGPESVAMLGEGYPHTYTNGNGYSFNAGYVVAGVAGSADRVNTNDPRIAGIQYHANDATDLIVRVDLSSGSAPGAGDYTVDLAMGDAGSANHQDFKLYDNTTLVLDASNGNAGFSTAAGHFRDATLTDVAATTTWTGTTVSQTFASTTVNLHMAPDNCGGYSTIAHFRLTLQGGAPPENTDITPPTARRLGT